MGMPVSQLINSTGNATALIIDWTLIPFNVGIALELQGASTGTFKAQYTLDDVNDPSVTATWFDITGTSGTATVAVSHTIPSRAVRANVSALSAAGTIRFVAIQGLPE